MKYTIELAKTTKDPEILRDILREGIDRGDYISQCAASNHNCPPDILKEIFKKGNNNWVYLSAIENPNCPSEILTEILNNGKCKNNLISCCAARNPNCPPEARINWMIKMGKIGKEDPSKHIIEYEEIKEDDFQDLKDLL